MRRQLDNGVSRKGVGDGVVFSLEFEPTEDNIATLLRGINVFPDLSAWTAGSQVGRVYVGDLDISQVKIIPVADMPASAGDGDDEDEDF
jgi:hypothetical protein